MKELILIDGKNLAYRAHYTHLNLTSQKRPTSVIYGFLSILTNVHNRWPSASIAVVWEGGGKTWRHELLAARVKRNRAIRAAQEVVEPKDTKDFKAEKGYKGTRDKTGNAHELINEQIPILRRFLEDIGIRNFSCKGIEADDLIGLLSHFCIDTLGYDKVIIYSTDRDFFQLISDNVIVWRPKGGESKPTIITKQAVLKDYQVPVSNWIKYRAIVGDSSDNIPQILRGIGPVRARALLDAGLDPSQEKFENMPASVKANVKEFKELWTDLHENYHLCKIIRKMSNKHLSDDVKHRLSEMFRHLKSYGIARDRTKLKESNYRLMIDFLLDYELESIYQKKQVLWDIP